MDVAVIGTGFIGGILGRALARAGHAVTFGSRTPQDGEVIGDTDSRVASIPDALAAAPVVILALPGRAVAAMTAEHGELLRGRLIIDATNRMGEAVVNARGALPAEIRYARAFNTLGGENLEDPVFPGGVADMFFSAPDADRSTVEEVIRAVGLRPVFVGADQEELIDGLFRLWVALVMGQGRGRQLALRLLER
jgi:8-hydroxy-5-deazaflavin:NADPH oxidoreductase